MPKVVDHSARRVELGEAVLRVLARDGIDQLTLKAISREAGWSVGVLQHYFADRDDLVNFANQLAFERAERRIQDILSGDRPPLRTLELVLQEGLPLDRERTEEWSAWLAFWSHAVTNPHLGQAQARRYRVWRRFVVTLLQDAQATGDLPTDASIDPVAELLVALVDGIGVQAMFEPQRLPSSSLVQLLHAAMERLTNLPPNVPVYVGGDPVCPP